MPRPIRCRRVCCEPAVKRFAPEGVDAAAPVVLLVEEYEVVRIIDFEKRTHGQCAEQMQISRTTVTELYEKARFKIADAIVNAKPLVIDGGRYEICQESDCICCGRRCRRHTLQSAQNGTSGVTHMKVAIPVKNDSIFQHFGKAPEFKMYEVENNAVVGSKIVASAGANGHDAVVNLLVKNSVGCVICDGLGGGAVQALAEAGIELYAGNSGSADEAVAKLIAGELTNDVEAATAGRGGHCHGHHGEGCGCHGHGHGHGHGECGCHGHGHGKEGECECGGQCECGKEECDCNKGEGEHHCCREHGEGEGHHCCRGGHGRGHGHGCCRKE